ncbi:glycosyltransferase [Streptosporangium sp. NPDC000509]|uniref:glycosyltransferase n=1 Tax=Streptosporangium sp. NPDC000509 TaxID=3366186 RepID=UPI00368B6FAF
MSIGYGITASSVIRSSLSKSGFELIRPLAELEPFDDGSRSARLRWVLRGYERIAADIAERRPDLIFVFHSFSAFPTEIRRIMIELGIQVPMIGYTHGSHWDPSDSFRRNLYPQLEMLDLANLMALDRILFGSDFIKTTILDNVGSLNHGIARSVAARSVVTGIPIDTGFIDDCRTYEKYSRTTVVFNHALVPAKNPLQFISMIKRVMAEFDVNVLITRAATNNATGFAEIRALRKQFGERVLLGGDMPLPNYFRALWMSDIQVSTAAHESLGIATLEAMYTENCCLLPHRGSYPEICANNEDVLYGSIDELEHRLIHFITNPEAARLVGRTLSKQARLHDAAAVNSRLMNVIEDILGIDG